MIGNERTIELVLTCLVAKGHILLEDVPGTGKTVMAKSLAKSVEAEFVHPVHTGLTAVRCHRSQLF